MIKGVLFDLDGTLADTAPDLGAALNRLRGARKLPALPLEMLRLHASHGARGLLKAGFDIEPDNPGYHALREEFLNLYNECLCVATRLFPGMPELLNEIEKRGMPWGVVTNKPERFTLPLMESLELRERASCIVSGDTTSNIKPHPESLLTAAGRLGLSPQTCVFVGDDERDVAAGRAAKMRAVVALYGYLGNDARPETWGADALIAHPAELLDYL